MHETEPRIRPSQTQPAAAMLPDDDDALAFLDALARALEERDPTLRQHSQRVGFYADLLAEQLGLDADTPKEHHLPEDLTHENLNRHG